MNVILSSNFTRFATYLQTLQDSLSNFYFYRINVYDNLINVDSHQNNLMKILTEYLYIKLLI